MGYFDDIPSTNPSGGYFDDIAPQESTAFQKGEYRTGPVQDLPRQPSPFSVLPLSSDIEGKIQFDSRAGILGTLLVGPRLTQDASEGKVDFSSPEGIGRTLEAALSMTPALSLRSRAMQPIAAPARDALKAAEDTGYNAVREASVPYNSDVLASHIGDLRSGLLEEHGIKDVVAPKALDALNTLEAEAAKGPTTNIRDIEIARRQLNAAAGDLANRSEGKAARYLKQGLEDFVSNPPQGAVPAGKFDDAIAAAGLMSDARGNAAARFRADTLDKLKADTDIDALRGADPAKAIKTRAAQILKSEKLSRGFSEDELGVLREVVGSGGVASKVGGILGGGGLGAVTAGAQRGAAGLTFGGIPGGILGAASPLLGNFAKYRGGANTQKALEAVNELVRQRSPMYRDLLENAPVPMPYSQWRSLAPAIGIFGTNAFLNSLHEYQ
jgi:hypothetical protein